MNTVHITADHREAASGVIAELQRDARVELRVETLEVGDYIVGDGVVIERKSATDLANSVIDKRLFSQVDAIKDGGYRAIYLIEGDPFSTPVGISDEAMSGAISYVACFENIRMVSSPSVSHTPMIIRTIAHHVEHGLMGSLPALRPATPKTLRDRQAWFLIGLPGLGEGRVAKLLDHFGSVSAVLAASVDELCAAPTIGRKTAEGIRAVLDTAW